LTTIKLYHENAYTKDFTANITKITSLPNAKWAVTLDRTAFYPTSGGQPFDKGMLDDLPVIDVQEDGEDIIHITEARPVTGKIEGHIQWQRRFNHMQQHSGQHLLSGAFYSVLQANTVSFHLGTESNQIDLDIEDITSENLLEVEILANQIVFSTKALHTHWLTQDTIHSFPLRKAPAKDFAEIRLVEITDFDYSACCGTHVANTGEIGLIKIRNWERKNNGTRIDFVCGWRALGDYQQKNSILQQVSSRLSLPDSEILQGIEKQLLKAEALSKELISVKQEFYRNLATTLSQQGEIIGHNKLIVHTLTNITPHEINNIAKELVNTPHTIVCIGGINADETKVHLIFSASPDVPLSMNHEIKNILPLIDGKGGGSAQSAQGGGSNVKQLPTALTLAADHIKEQLYLL